MSTRDQLGDLKKRGEELYKAYAPFRVDAPVGQRGKWKVYKFKTEMGLAYLRFMRDGREPGLGEFTGLAYKTKISWDVIMSDTCPEVDDLKRYVDLMAGNILVTGLGLGMALHLLVTTRKTKIRSITVVEKSQDVIHLTGDHWKMKVPNLSIVHADAHKWLPPKGVKFDCAWHDIWPELGEDQRADAQKLREHFKHAVPIKNQFFWGQHIREY